MNVSRQGGYFQPRTLDVDEKIFDRNLRIVDGVGEDDNFGMGGTAAAIAKSSKTSLLPEPNYPSLQVVPDPGMCVKTRNVNDQKVFINVCKIQAIPPPKPITEERLQKIIQDEDYTSDFTIPMSLGAPRKEKDKSGNDCLVCDVAVSSVWFDETMQNSLTFTTFMVNLAMEGLCDKYGDECNMDRQTWTILRNRKYMGKTQRHTIQQRANVSKIQEVDVSAAPGVNPKQPLITPLDSSSSSKTEPEFVLLKDPADEEDPEFLIAEISLPLIKSKSDILLDVGEDRLVLEVKNSNIYLDIFLPFMVYHNESVAKFNRDSNLLTVTMKVN